MLKFFDYFPLHKWKLKETYIYEVNLFLSPVLSYSEQKYIMLLGKTYFVGILLM